MIHTHTHTELGNETWRAIQKIRENRLIDV